MLAFPAEQDTSTVTDAGFASLALFTSRLKSLRLTNLPRVRGALIAGLLERCPSLEVLHLENLPRCWEGQGFSSAIAVRARSLRTLSILGCKVDISAAALLAKVPELRSFSYDGPASLMRLLCTFWYDFHAFALMQCPSPCADIDAAVVIGGKSWRCKAVQLHKTRHP